MFQNIKKSTEFWVLNKKEGKRNYFNNMEIPYWKARSIE